MMVSTRAVFSGALGSSNSRQQRQPRSASTCQISFRLLTDRWEVAPPANDDHRVPSVLRRMGYSLQANSKTREGNQHIDRDAQFHYINTRAKAFLAAHEPIVSADTKKKELVGNFKNNGKEWRPNGTPELVNIHDFIDPKLSRAVPYGVCDITNNVGWVSVGTDHDTAAFGGQCNPPLVKDHGT